MVQLQKDQRVMEVHFPISFTKMSGTGNDFIIIDHRQKFIAEKDQPEFARLVCRRTFSVGADGLILIEAANNADFRWRFYNSDGSVAAMCGNGARCAARFAHTNGIASREMVFATDAGMISAEVDTASGLVKVQLTSPKDFRGNLLLQLGGESHTAFSINTGVPHAVVFVENAQDFPVKELGKIARFHPLFQPDGTNVNFVQIISSDELFVRTYERGVEDETMACGTGAVASALVASMMHGLKSPIRIRTSGGENLTVFFEEKHTGLLAESVFLQGSTRTVFTGNMTAEALQ